VKLKKYVMDYARKNNSNEAKYIPHSNSVSTRMSSQESTVADLLMILNLHVKFSGLLSNRSLYTHTLEFMSKLE